MRVSVTEQTGQDGVSVVTVDGRFDAHSASDVQERIDALVGSGAIRVVIDLTDVTFLDSAGLAVLVTALKHARQARGDVKLVWPASEDTRRILRLTRFDRVFDIADTTDEAIKRY